MAEKHKIHPSITDFSENVLKQHRLTASGGLETLTVLLATKNVDMAIRYTDLINQKNFYKKQVKEQEQSLAETKRKLNNVENEIKEIDNLRANYDIKDTKDFKDALEKVEMLLNIPAAEYKHTKKTRIKKIKLQEIIDIADEFNVPCDLILENTDQQLIKKYLLNGEFIKIGGYNSKKK